MNAPATVTRTHCPYCALQCGMELHTETGTPPRAAGWEAFGVNRGALCQKGATAPELLAPAVRLTSPLIRRAPDAELEPATWDEALDFAAGRLGSIAAEHGR